MTRPYRGSVYHIVIERDAALPEGESVVVNVDGTPLVGNLLAPPDTPGICHEVRVRCR